MITATRWTNQICLWPAANISPSRLTFSWIKPLAPFFVFSSSSTKKIANSRLAPMLTSLAVAPAIYSRSLCSLSHQTTQPKQLLRSCDIIFSVCFCWLEFAAFLQYWILYFCKRWGGKKFSKNKSNAKGLKAQGAKSTPHLIYLEVKIAVFSHQLCLWNEPWSVGHNATTRRIKACRRGEKSLFTPRCRAPPVLTHGSAAFFHASSFCLDFFEYKSTFSAISIKNLCDWQQSQSGYLPTTSLTFCLLNLFIPKGNEWFIRSEKLEDENVCEGKSRLTFRNLQSAKNFQPSN